MTKQQQITINRAQAERACAVFAAQSSGFQERGERVVAEAIGARAERMADLVRYFDEEPCAVSVNFDETADIYWPLVVIFAGGR